jgi:hypothetical protein
MEGILTEYDSEIIERALSHFRSSEVFVSAASECLRSLGRVKKSGILDFDHVFTDSALALLEMAEARRTDARGLLKTYKNRDMISPEEDAEIINTEMQ